MEIKTIVNISKDEIIELIKEKYKIEGDFNFIIREITKMAGDVPVTRKIFDGVEITTLENR